MVHTAARARDRGADRQCDWADRINNSKDHFASRWRWRISDGEQREIEDHIRGVYSGNRHHVALLAQIPIT